MISEYLKTFLVVHTYTIINTNDKQVLSNFTVQYFNENICFPIAPVC